MRSLLSALVTTAVAAAACGDVNTALVRQSEARQLAADLLVQFTRAADASNRAVMSESDEASQALVREAREARDAIQKDIASMTPILAELAYADEQQRLRDFQTHFTEYQALDDRILDLAVENTNLKAQRLSFGPAQAAADALRDAVTRAAAAGKDRCRAGAGAASAIAAVRDIQALQAPHIADPDDGAMTRIEERMSAAERLAREALASLSSTAPAARADLAAATAALNRFLAVNVEIIGLSRRNTNVRSLAMSLTEKRSLIAPCEESLRALRAALSKRGYPGGRTS